ncbi:MAG: ABC transporter substrate-binding protein [Deltaproteobacteria bacterium]|nr:ABC transporter substrate-binding protein [Deltaproteobacteria bacterium]
MLRKGLGITVCGLVAVLFIAAIAYAETQGVTDDEIRIGACHDLSGSQSAWSIDACNGIRLRFDEANEKGGVYGRKLRYLTEDHQYQVPLGIQKANKLINRDKVFMMMGDMGTAMAKAYFNQIMIDKNIPLFLPTSGAKDLALPFNRLKYTAWTFYYDQARAVTKYFVEEKGKKRVGIAWAQSGYGKECLAGITDQLKAMNMEPVEVTSHAITETNFIGHVNKHRKANCDVIIMAAIVQDGVKFVQTVKELGWNDVELVGLQGMVADAVPELGGQSMEGVYMPCGFEVVEREQVTDPRGLAFFENYKKRYGDWPSSNSCLGYTFADITVVALEKAGKDLTVDSFIDAADSISQYKSLFGGADRSFSTTDHVGMKETQLYWIMDGKFVSPEPGKKILLTY